MKKTVYFFWMAVFVATACAPVPTPTPAPTSTPVPTATLVSTKTRVPGTPTPTSIYPSVASDNANFERAYESEHYKVYYDAADEQLARATILAGEQIYPLVVRILGGAPPTKTAVYVFMPGAKADKLFSRSRVFNPAGGEAVFDQSPPLGDGIRIYNPIGILKAESDEASAVLRWLLSYTVGRRVFWYTFPNIRSPAGARWLEEGFVMYAALEASPTAPMAMYGWYQAWSAFRPDRPFILNSATIDSYLASGQTDAFYGRAVTTIHLIAKNYGEDGLRRLFAEFNKNANLPDAFVKALGISIGDLQGTLNNSLAEARMRAAGSEAGFYEAFTGKPRPTPVPTRTPTLTPAPEAYLRNVWLGKLPVGVQASPPSTVPVSTTVFTANDQVCFSADIVRDVQIAVSVVNGQTKSLVVPKVVNPDLLKADTTYVMCMPIVGLMLPGKYEVQISVGGAVVLMPFEVR